MTVLNLVMDKNTAAALDRLLAAAQGDSGQSARCADFLLAWWNAADCGGFDLTALWGLDDELGDDCVRVFTWITRNRHYPDDIGYGPQFQTVWKLWRGNAQPQQR
jgi:hypothetical protein